MKAFYSKKYGGIETMEFGELPNPKIKNKEVLVEVKASSINPVDWKVRNGMMRFISGGSFPKIYGVDFAGTISEIGSGVKNFQKGDRVYGRIPVMFGKQGAHAELASVAEENLRHIPKNFSFEQAASLPVASLTALQVISHSDDLSGKKILINGATGGVGHFAVQFAKAKGAIVTGVCSEKNTPIAKKLGADKVLDYKKTDFRKESEKYDIIFDAHGHLDFSLVKNALADRGIFMSTLPNPKLVMISIFENIFGKHKIVLANMRSKQTDFAELEKYISEGKITPIIGKEFPLEKARDAFQLSEAGGVVGKIVLKIAP